MEQIRVLLADNKKLFREGLAKLLESNPHIDVIYECTDGSEVLERAKETEPDVVLMHADIQGCDIIDTAQHIRESLPTTRVAILDASHDEKGIFSALGIGASGYIDSKETDSDGFVKSIELIAEGQVVLSGSLTNKLVEEVASGEQKRKASGGNELSETETEVVKLVGKGLTNREIAETLICAENTVKVHIRNILEKLNLRNKQQIAVHAVQQDLVMDIADRGKEP